MRNHLPYIIISCAMIFSYSQAKAQVKGNPQLKTPTVRQPAIQKSSSKLSTDLKKVYENYGAGERKAESKAKPVQPNSGLDNFIQIKGDQVLVDITVKGDSKTARAELEKMGVKVNGVFGRVISGMIPIKALPQLESAKNVHFARPAYKPMHQFQPAGSIMNKEKPGGKITPVVTQGDTAQRSYLARKKRHREKRGVNGTGVKVGILSDSYNNLGTADIGVKRGELPGPANPFRYKKPVQVLLDLDSNGRDEGRGMMEIIHDVAPGAELAFNTAFIGQAAFAQGILDLAAAGCKVITDDVTYFEEPFFQDGIVAQAVDMVKQKGVTYFASAGNNSVRSYESNYRSSDYSPFGVEAGTAHNFSPPGDPPVYFQPIFIPTGGEFIISFQYDQPFFSAGGAGAESDLDIYLLDSLGNIVAGGFSDNILRGDPVEIFSYLNGNENNTYYLAILKFSGPDPSRLKYIFFGQGLFYLTNPPIPGILAPTIIGHAKAEGAITTAAVFFSGDACLWSGYSPGRTFLICWRGGQLF